MFARFFSAQPCAGDGAAIGRAFTEYELEGLRDGTIAHAYADFTCRHRRRTFSVWEKMMGLLTTAALFYGLALVPLLYAGLAKAGVTVTFFATVVTVAMLIAVAVVYSFVLGGAELNTAVPFWVSGILASGSIVAGVRLIRRND